MGDVEDVKVVVAHRERVTVRVGDVFLKIRAWWSMRSLLAIRWLVEHGFGPIEEMPEVAVLRSGLMRPRRWSTSSRLP